MAAWTEAYEAPPVEEMRRVGAANPDVFFMQAARIAAAVEQQLKSLGLDRDSDVLDFGAGIGRVALPLHHAMGLPSHACDINEAAMSYLSRQLPKVDCRTTPYMPPLPYADASFDAVYSISIWTHLPPDTGMAWLKEIRRILRPGGVALLSTSGVKVISVRAERGDAGWKDYTVEDLAREGVLYAEYGSLSATQQAYPGVTASYGLTAHHPDHVRETWSEIMPVEDIKIEAIDNIQDLVTLRRPAE